MKKNNFIILVVAMAIVAVTAFKITNAESSKTDTGNKEEKSVAWYVANTKEARDQNKECHDNPSLQSTPECINSLHALEISFAGGSGRR